MAGDILCLTWMGLLLLKLGKSWLNWNKLVTLLMNLNLSWLAFVFHLCSISWVVVINLPSHTWLFATPWTAAHRLPCPSVSPRVYPNTCPLSWGFHPTISSSVDPFSSCPQPFPVSGSFPKSHFFTSGGQNMELQLQHQSFQWIFRIDFL